MENFIKQVKDNSETVASRTLESLTFLISEKKNARRSYLDQRNSLDSQMTKVSFGAVCAWSVVWKIIRTVCDSFVEF